MYVAIVPYPHSDSITAQRPVCNPNDVDHYEPTEQHGRKFCYVSPSSIEAHPLSTGSSLADLAVL